MRATYDLDYVKGFKCKPLPVIRERLAESYRVQKDYTEIIKNDRFSYDCKVIALHRVLREMHLSKALNKYLMEV